METVGSVAYLLLGILIGMIIMTFALVRIVIFYETAMNQIKKAAEKSSEPPKPN